MTLHEERTCEIDKEYDDMLEERRRFEEELANFEMEKEASQRNELLQQVATGCLLKGEKQLDALVRLACVVTALLGGALAISIDRLYFDGTASASLTYLGWRVACRLAD